jgi:hypothetical protein
MELVEAYQEAKVSGEENKEKIVKILRNQSYT